jgi:hypothetical protein
MVDGADRKNQERLARLSRTMVGKKSRPPELFHWFLIDPPFNDSEKVEGGARVSFPGKR